MDGRQFDALVQWLVPRDNRRSVLRGLAGGALALLAGRRPGSASRQTGAIELGQPCQTSEQCKQDFMGSEIICAANDVEKDGALNCCREDGCCVRDVDCCGDRLCAPSGDVCSFCARPPFPTRCPGEPCDEDAECVPSVVGSVVCGDNGIAKDGSKNCCIEAGGSCPAGEHGYCCGELRCVENRCQDSALVADRWGLLCWFLRRSGPTRAR